MKSFKVLFALAFLLLSVNSFSQQMTDKQKESEQRKVNLFTSEEKDNLQVFYANQVDKMKLSEDKREEYYNILLFHTHQMSRLDDKDKDYTETEITEKFNSSQDRMNEKMKLLLTPEQYVMHLEAFSKIIYSVNRKKEQIKN